MEEYACLPIVVATVYESLGHPRDFKSGQNLLIHTATGGVGMVAVHYGLHCGANILATAGMCINLSQFGKYLLTVA